MSEISCRRLRYLVPVRVVVNVRELDAHMAGGKRAAMRTTLDQQQGKARHMSACAGAPGTRP